MGIYENNINIIADYHPLVYKAIGDKPSVENVYIGDSYIQGRFLVLERDEQLYSFDSTYDPCYEAKRFLAQFKQMPETMKLVLFGFGMGYIAEEFLKDPSKSRKIIIYEPSAAMLKKALEARELSHVFTDTRLELYVGCEQLDELKKSLERNIQYYNFRHYSYQCLYRYKELFAEDENIVYLTYRAVLNSQITEYSTMLRFQIVSTRCEIHTFRYLMHAKNFYALKPYIDPDIPCIIIGAGPSLEKNVQELKKAVGKAVIFAVDSAVGYLVSQGIVPDITCTIDPKKDKSYSDPRTHKIPVAITTTSPVEELDRMGIPEAMYFSSQSILHKRIFQLLGIEMPCVHGGGCVALNAFELAVALGFHTIIFAGQDLAWQDSKTHAGKAVGHPDELNQAVFSVEGYYGDYVLTPKNMKDYIEWYADRIPTMTDCNVINSTEGGAKIPGTVQMSLGAAIDQYCSSEFDFHVIYQKIPYLVDTPDKRREIYDILESHYCMLRDLKTESDAAVANGRKAMDYLQRQDINPNELMSINESNLKVLDHMALSEASDMIYRHMFDMEMTMADHLNQDEEDPIRAAEGLYKIMTEYLSRLSETLDFMINIWHEVLDLLKE